MGRVRRRIEANARADALSTAEVRALPQIVDQLGADRALVRDRLHALLAGRGTAGGRIGAALALLPDEPSQAQFLFDRLVMPEATPDEVLVIREGLLRNGALEPFIEPTIAGLRPPSEPLDDAAMRTAGPAGPGTARLGSLAGIRRADRRQARASQSVRDRRLAGGLPADRRRARRPAAGDLRRTLGATSRGPWRSRCCWNSPRSRTGPTDPRPWPDCSPTRTRPSCGRSFAACPRARIGTGPSR